MKTTTHMPKREDTLASRRWYLIDAEGKVLGRLATRIANILRGKHKPTFVPYEDVGDFVIVVNAGAVRLTGDKMKGKVYRRHSGYPGGIRNTTAQRLSQEHPERILRQAVEGMLPKNRLGRQLATKLKIYVGHEHPHAAQQPLTLAK